MAIAEAPHLMEVVKRVKTPEDAEVAMEVARQYALQRAHRQQHDGLSPNMSYIILKVHTPVKLYGCAAQPASLPSLLVSSALQQHGGISHHHLPHHIKPRPATQDAPYAEKLASGGNV